MLIGKGEQAALVEGSGAAGGIAYGLLHYAQAALRSGFDIVSEITQLEKHIAEADIVITGEGSLDEQTLNGKGPQGVAKLAKNTTSQSSPLLETLTTAPEVSSMLASPLTN